MIEPSHPAPSFTPSHSPEIEVAYIIEDFVGVGIHLLVNIVNSRVGRVANAPGYEEFVVVEDTGMTGAARGWVAGDDRL